MIIRRWYPSLVGLLLGLLQTGLFFHLTFTLSSSFGSFLLVTLCWLIGSAGGALCFTRFNVKLNMFLLLALAAYFACAVLLGLFPFNTTLWPIYGLLIGLSGIYPGVFFARLGRVYRASDLFFRENNGFIFGLLAGTLLFMVFGRAALWVLPLLVAAGVYAVDVAEIRRQVP